MCYQVCAIVVVECLRLKKRNFKHTLQWVSLKTFSLISHFISLAFFSFPFFKIGCCIWKIPSICMPTSFLNYQSYILRQYTKTQRNVFTCYGFLKRTKEKQTLKKQWKDSFSIHNNHCLVHCVDAFIANCRRSFQFIVHFVRCSSCHLVTCNCLSIQIFPYVTISNISFHTM